MKTHRRLCCPQRACPVWLRADLDGSGRGFQTRSRPCSDRQSRQTLSICLTTLSGLCKGGFDGCSQGIAPRKQSRGSHLCVGAVSTAEKRKHPNHEAYGPGNCSVFELGQRQLRISLSVRVCIAEAGAEDRPGQFGHPLRFVITDRNVRHGIWHPVGEPCRGGCRAARLVWSGQKTTL